MTDDQRLPDPIAVARRIPKGWGLIFRHYSAVDRTELALRTAKVCRRRGIVMLIAGNWRLADQVGADGIHVQDTFAQNQTLAPMLHWRRQQGRLMTLSAHGPEGLRRARVLKADAALLSPVFTTASHPGAKVLGALTFSALARDARRPVYALGGVTLTQKQRLQNLGAGGVAGIGFLETL